MGTTQNIDYNLRVSEGKVSGQFVVNKFGANPAIASGTTEDVWDGGGTYDFPTTATITYLSQKTNQAAMLGANIEIQGLDANWDRATQIVALDATNTTTPVILSTPLIRVFRMKVFANVVTTEEISVHNTANTIDYAIIGEGFNQTLMAIYTVPAGYTAYLTKYYCTVVESTGKEPISTRFGLWAADRGNGYEFQIKHVVGIPQGGSMVEHEFLPYAGKALEKTDIKITANPENEAGDVAAGFDLILVED